MRGSSIGRRLSLLVILAVAFGARAPVAQAQQSALPANWQQLSPSDIATLVQGYLQQGTFQSLSGTDQASLAAQGAQLFSQIDISNTAITYRTLLTLAVVDLSQLDQWTLAQAKSALIARSDNWTGKAYAEMRAKVMLMGRLQVPDSVVLIQGRNWVLAGGTSDQVPQTDLVYDPCSLVHRGTNGVSSRGTAASHSSSRFPKLCYGAVRPSGVALEFRHSV